MNRGKYGAKGLESKGVFTIYYCFRLHFHLIGQPPKHLFPDWWTFKFAYVKSLNQKVLSIDFLQLLQLIFHYH